MLFSRKKYKKISLLKKLYVIFMFKKYYAINFIADTLKLALFWYFMIKFAFILRDAIWYMSIPTFWRNVFFYVGIIYSISYYEVFFWVRPYFYALDYYMVYVMFKLISFLEKLEMLWVHRR
jgi:hypothetical protein